MILEKIKLTQYKNHLDLEVTPSVKWNIITGLNGRGKTNALDAVYMICVLKSFLNHSLDASISWDQKFFRLDASTANGDRIEISHPLGGTRKIIFNGKNIRKVSDYIGRYPIMVIQPIDDYKLLEGSQARRRILDQAISQMNPAYLKALMLYNRIIKQRNALLKRMRAQGSRQVQQLEIYEPQLNACVKELYEGRSNLVQEMSSDLIIYYSKISSGQEKPEVAFKSDVNPEEYLEVMRRNVDIDIAAGRTTRGPHLDDLNMVLNNYPLKSSGSQGQRKSFLVAVKLSIYQIMRAWTNKMPILLLDDLFDKLDNERVKNLLNILNDENFGQIFITDKDDEHLTEIFSSLHYNFKQVKLS